MKYYPVCLDIRNRSCLVVGGGQVGTRKVETLLECGAKVIVISPKVTETLAALSDQGRIQLHLREYCSADLQAVFLVIGATDDKHLNRKIHGDAEQAQRLCNIADQPHLCNFILPSIISQGDLMVTISTSGRSPAFAKHLRRQLQDRFGPEYDLFLQLMGAVRERLLATEHAPEAHKPIFEELIRSDLLDMIKKNDVQAIDGLLAELLDKTYRFNDLMKKD